MNSSEKLCEIYKSSQRVFRDSLDFCQVAFSHPVMKGSAKEMCWIEFLSKHLPLQYGVGTGKIIDKNGSESNQIDIIIYDRMASPMLINEHGTQYFPIEGVYAVFEVKSDAKSQFKYASKKIKSVRELKPSFLDANGESIQENIPIIGGLLANKCKTTNKTIEKNLIEQSACHKGWINMICCVKSQYIRVEYDHTINNPTIYFYKESPLFAFLFHLLHKLEQKRVSQNGYTMDIDAYLKPINANIGLPSIELF